MKPSPSENRRKRQKMQCMKCGSCFDDDYQRRHEMAVHGGNRVSVKAVGAIGVGCSDSAWTEKGVRQWHKMKSVGKNKKGKMEKHFSSAAHKAALRDYCNFVGQNTQIDVLLKKSFRETEIQAEQEHVFNTEVIKILADTVRTLARQGLALRGDENDENSNFQQIVKLLSRHSYIMKKWLNNRILRPYHTTYFSKKSQEEFVTLIAQAIRKEIINEIKMANIYTVIADTTPDVSHEDRLVINIRFVDTKGQIKERLLGITKVTDKTGNGIAKEICEQLNKHGLSLNNIAFQSYDFASSMSGEYQGAQKKLSEIVGYTVPYIPCQAHRINTFVEHSCNTSIIIRDMFNVLESLYAFFVASTKRYSLLSSQLAKVENSLSLRNLSKTRWTSRAEAIKSVTVSFEEILQVLAEISTSKKFDTKTKADALGLQKKMLTFDFIASLIFMKNIMYKQKNLTENMEAEELNVIDAALLTQSFIVSIELINNDKENMDHLIESAIEFAKKFDVNPEDCYKRHHRKRTRPVRFDAFSSTETEFDLKAYYRKEFSEVLNTLINLTKDNLKKFFDSIIPLFKIFAPPMNRDSCKIEHVQGAIKLFPPSYSSECNTDSLSLQAELEILADRCEGIDTISGIMQKAEELKNILPLANNVCRLALTTPVTVASNERTFSKLKRIKTYLRSTMNDDRLDNLLLMNSEKDILDNIDFGKLIKSWASLKRRRISLNKN